MIRPTQMPSHLRLGKVRPFMLLGLLVAAAVMIAVLFAVAMWFPRSPAVEIPAADVTQANVQVAEVVNRLRQEVANHPDSVAAWGEYGEILMAHEWNAEALACFQRASELDSQNMRWPYLSGILLERKQPEEALKKFEKAMALKNDYAPLHYRMSKLLLRMNSLTESEAAMKQAAKLASDQPQPWIGLARIAQARDDWQAAHDLLAQAQKIAPDNREAIVELTRTKVMLGTATALKREEQLALTSGQKYQPMFDPIFNSINEKEVAARFAAVLADQYAASGNTQQAEEAFRQLIARRPNLSRPRLNLASLYMQQRKFNEALKTLQEAVQLFPDDAMAHYLLSFALEATQQLPQARQALEAAVRLKPDYAEAQYALGLSLQRDQDLAGAETAYRQAVQSDTRMPQAHVALGVVLQKQAKWDEAIAEINKAIALAPGDPVPKSYLQKAVAARDAQMSPK